MLLILGLHIEWLGTRRVFCIRDLDLRDVEQEGGFWWKCPQVHNLTPTNSLWWHFTTWLLFPSQACLLHSHTRNSKLPMVPRVHYSLSRLLVPAFIPSSIKALPCLITWPASLILLFLSLPLETQVSISAYIYYVHNWRLKREVLVLSPSRPQL